MNRKKAILLALWWVCFLVACAGAETVAGRVVGVSDGDTITVLDADREQHKIRLNGIDAPESDQDFGQASKRHLSEIVFGKDVTVAWRKIDRYGRLVGIVLLGSTDVNLEQIRSGLAWYFRKYEGDVPAEKRKPYADAESEARTAGRGLWRQPNPTPPWEWREKKRSDAPPASSGSTSPATSGRVIANRNSFVYHLPGCPDYEKVSEKNRVYFTNAQEAETAGYRRARNCPAR